jgi:hypothetical protein
MSSLNRPRVVDPRKSRIIEQAYESAWAEFVGHDPGRDFNKDGELRELLRKRLFEIVWRGEDAETLRDRVLASMSEYWPATIPSTPKLTKGRRQRAGN